MTEAQHEPTGTFQFPQLVRKAFNLWTQVRVPISLSKRIGHTIFSAVWGLLHVLHNKPVTFPALPEPIYTPGLRELIMAKYGR